MLTSTGILGTCIGGGCTHQVFESLSSPDQGRDLVYTKGLKCLFFCVDSQLFTNPHLHVRPLNPLTT